MAAKMTTIVGDVTGLQQRHHPKSIPHLVKTTKGRIVSKYFNIWFKNGLPHWVGPTTRSENLCRNINCGYALVSLETSLDNLGLFTIQCWGFSVSLIVSIVLFRSLLVSFSVCNNWGKSRCNVSSQARTEILEFPRLLYAIDTQLNTKPI